MQPAAYYPIRVAPLVGAWIETGIFGASAQKSAKSHPSWVRGLKPRFGRFINGTKESHPSWVRGLKLRHRHHCRQG